MLTTIDDKWYHRIMHQLRDVEYAVRATANHDPNVGIHEVAERLAVLRLLIESAFESTN